MEEYNQRNKNEITPFSTQRHQTMHGSNKKFFVMIAVALMLIAAIWFWKNMEISSVKKNAEIDKQGIKNIATRHIVQSHEEHLKLLAKPFVWAVRGEMMQGNMNQVNLFASDLVKEKNFQRIVIANDQGTIVSSTNKKDEGQPFSTVGNINNISSNITTVENVNDTVLIMYSPIMGFNNRLGTLLIRYGVEKTAL